MKHHRYKKTIALVVLLPILLALLSYVFMRLWNWLIPDIFGLKMINYWQAMGLFVLAKIAFSGFRIRGFKRKKYWNMEERLAGMSEDEKECFKREMRERCKKWSKFNGN